MIGEEIKKLRLAKGYTQKELGVRSRLSESAIRLYELGLRTPNPQQIEKIATGLEISPYVLLNSEFSNMQALYCLFQLFQQYGGFFSSDGSIEFKSLDLSQWYKRWLEYQDELAKIQLIDDVEKRTYALADAKDKFNWWMDTYKG